MAADVRIGLLVALGLAAGCADLQPMQAGACWNGVVEQEFGEECDRYPERTCGPEGNAPCVCREPGQADPCRYDCTGAAVGDRAACPAGYGCSVDGLCRRASGVFTHHLALELPDIARFAFGDFDGEGSVDVLVDAASSTLVHFGDGSAGLGPGLSRQTVPSPPAIGDLTQDGRDDLLFAAAEGLVLELGRADQSLQPTIYASSTLPSDGSRLLVFDAMPTLEVLADGGPVFAYSGKEVMVLAHDEPAHRTALYFVGPEGFAAAGELPEACRPQDIAGEIQVADVMEADAYDATNLTASCSEIAIGPNQSGLVYVYTPCRPVDPVDSPDWEWNGTGTGQLPAEEVALPPGRWLTQGILLADVNRDGHVDLLIGTLPTGSSDETLFQLAVAYGVGNGSFHSSPQLDVPTGCSPWQFTLCPGDGQSVLVDLDRFAELPLAVGDVNRDDLPDFMMPDRLLVSVGVPTAWAGALEDVIHYQQPLQATGWDWATIGNFNADTGVDIVAANSGRPQLTFLNNATPVDSGPVALFNEFEVPLAGKPSKFAVGDFDGDLLQDLAFAERDPKAEVPGAVPQDQLAVAFGSPYGAPGAPVRMGRLGGIVEIASGNITWFAPDAVSDLVVSADQAAARTAVILEGSTDRQLRSPFQFVDPDTDRAYQPLTAVTGSFVDYGEAGHLDVAAVTLGEYFASGEAVEEFPPPVSLDPEAPHALWIVPSSGEAQLDASLAVALSLPSDLFWCVAPLVAPIDLDRDGRDEIAVLGRGVTAAGALLVAKSDDGQAWRWVDAGSGPIQDLDQEYYYQPHRYPCAWPGGELGSDGPGGEAESPVGWYDGQIEVRDLDGDRAPELMATGLDFSDPESSGPRIVVFPNRGTGRLDGVDGMVLELRDGSGGEVTGATSFALLQADANPELEMAIATPDAVFIGSIDLAAGAVVGLEKVAGVPGGLRLGAIDFDRDGIDDLVVADEVSLKVFVGKAVVR